MATVEGSCSSGVLTGESEARSEAKLFGYLHSYDRKWRYPERIGTESLDPGLGSRRVFGTVARPVPIYDTMSEMGSAAAAGTGDAVRSIAWWVERSDREPMGPTARMLTVAAAVGLVIAVGLAVFGMWPVDIHLPLHHLGIMDPACGMTRGSAATMQGDLVEAWWYNPASPLVPVGGFVLVVRWLVGRATGRWLCVKVRATPWVVAVTLLTLAALEVNQQLHVDRLR